MLLAATRLCLAFATLLLALRSQCILWGLHKFFLDEFPVSDVRDVCMDGSGPFPLPTGDCSGASQQTCGSLAAICDNSGSRLPRCPCRLRLSISVLLYVLVLWKGIPSIEDTSNRSGKSVFLPVAHVRQPLRLSGASKWLVTCLPTSAVGLCVRFEVAATKRGFGQPNQGTMKQNLHIRVSLQNRITFRANNA